MDSFKKWMVYAFSSFFDLFYPNLCLACRQHLPSWKSIVCLDCAYHLPETGYHLDSENPLLERFWGRVDLAHGAALYHFVKGGRVQKLVHQLKYEGKRQIGIELGQYYGTKLLESPAFRKVDYIIPVPLHVKKLRLRGYNQSEAFAQGLGYSMNIKVMKNSLRRKMYNTSQTKKGRAERLENVLQAFEIKDSNKLKGKHLLLVDDVVTTGATLEACAMRLLEIPGTTISIATLAMAE